MPVCTHSSGMFLLLMIKKTKWFNTKAWGLFCRFVFLFYIWCNFNNRHSGNCETVISHFKTTMIRQFLTIFTFAVLCSCGQKGNNTESKVDSISNTTIETITTKPINKQADQGNNCSYDNQVSSLGIGLIIAPSKFEIYSDSLLKDKIANWDMYEDDGKINLCSKFWRCND